MIFLSVKCDHVEQRRCAASASLTAATLDGAGQQLTDAGWSIDPAGMTRCPDHA